MRKILLAATLTLALAACTDTTGLSGTIHTDAHPDTAQSALVTVTEFGDLQCPACKSAQDVVVEPLIAKYGTQIRFEFRHFPLASIHRFAMEAAEAAECAADQGMFWEFVEHAYEHQSELSSEALRDWARTLGLDTDLFDRCVRSHVKRKAIQASYDEGRANGVQGTPTFFVNGQQTPANVETLSTAIDAALEQAAILR